MNADLRRLWQEAFGDSDAFLDSFFATGFSSDRCHYLAENGEIVSALYWFDCYISHYKLAYLYAVATAKKHRGKGLAQKLMTQTHSRLAETGYAGAILVPGEEPLFAFYEKLGYRKATQIREFTCKAGTTPVSLQKIDAKQYASLRAGYLPQGGVVQTGATLAFLQTQTDFYAGEDFLLADRELLGNADAAPGILRTLGLAEGRFRTPGNQREFAMFLPLQENCPTPAYFGLALD